MKKQKNKKTESRIRRHARIRTRIIGSAETPRLAVFKSNRSIYAQVINDELGITTAAASSLNLKGTMMEKSKKVGKTVAEAAIAKGIKKVVFDRGGFLYAGHVKALAEAAREAGLKF